MKKSDIEKVMKEKKEAICDLLSRHGNKVQLLCMKYTGQDDIFKMSIFTVAFIQGELTRRKTA